MYTDPVRMRKLQVILALGTAFSTVAVASQSRVASVNFTYREAPLRGYRMGDEFLLPLENVSDLGWSASSANAGVKIVADDKTLNVPTRQVEGKTCIPLRQAVEQLGGLSSWNPGGYDVLQISSPIYNVTVKDGTINIKSALAVKSTISVIGSHKLVIDLEGARIQPDTKIDGANAVQYGPNTVRIAVNLDFTPDLSKALATPSTKLSFNLNPEPIKPKEIKVKNPEPPQKDEPQKTNKPEDQKPTVDPSQPIAIPISLEWENETTSSLSIRFQPGQWKGAATTRRPDRDVLEIVLANLNGVLPDKLDLHSSAVKNVSARQEGTTTIVRLQLKRAMGADITSSATGVAINLIRPNDTGGKLAGKVVVIDAGHGGRDLGSSAGGAYEKNVTVFLAKYVRDALTAEGVTVIMTRSDDSFPELEARPALANKAHADIFISIHANEPGRGSNNNPSGTITFFHMGSSISKFLGECIHGEIVKSKLLPDLGVRSDGTIYKNSGFAVLRLSQMPAILIETGFMTNQKDRQMIQSEAFGKALAKSVVEGLKTYYGK